MSETTTAPVESTFVIAVWRNDGSISIDEVTTIDSANAVEAAHRVHFPDYHECRDVTVIARSFDTLAILAGPNTTTDALHAFVGDDMPGLVEQLFRRHMNARGIGDTDPTATSAPTPARADHQFTATAFDVRLMTRAAERLRRFAADMPDDDPERELVEDAAADIAGIDDPLRRDDVLMVRTLMGVDPFGIDDPDAAGRTAEDADRLVDAAADAIRPYVRVAAPDHGAMVPDPREYGAYRNDPCRCARGANH